ncbi:failed axon connections homolog [Haliotis asinina]|uniref:failed axon connections homolog n=1 Tax=Haliotis asinina TaxID=109174 RepID=UPI003531EDC1
MPCFLLFTNVAASAIPKGFLSETTKIISKAIRKPESYITVRIHPGQMMTHGGTTEPCANSELQAIGHISAEENIQMSKEISEFLKSKLGIDNTSVPKIILYQLGRGPRCPSLSPFAVKLETYMRMAQLEYTNDHGGKYSSKGKIPWIKYNGEPVADSQFCVEYLNRKLNIDLSSHLTKEQRAVAHSFRKTAEESLHWCIILTLMENMNIVKVSGFNALSVRLAVYKYRKQTRVHGIGRHTNLEMLQIMEGDLRALSDYIGKKTFLFGDHPCEADAALFGQLAQICWQSPGTKGEQLMHEKFTNLVEYCESMRAKFWPDWDDCITADGTKEATK